jgi:hypothetical protein
LCGVRPDSITSFSMVQLASDAGNAAGLVFFLFDLLYLDGEDLTARPLCDAAVCATISSGPPRIAVAALAELRAVLDLCSTGRQSDRSLTRVMTKGGSNETSLDQSLVLDLDRGDTTMSSAPAPDGLLPALAELLLQALGKQIKAIPTRPETCDAAEDHV